MSTLELRQHDAMPGTMQLPVATMGDQLARLGHALARLPSWLLARLDEWADDRDENERHLAAAKNMADLENRMCELMWAPRR